MTAPRPRKDELRSIANDARECAEFYRERPGLVQPDTICDLYATLARLCDFLAADESVS